MPAAPRVRLYQLAIPTAAFSLLAAFAALWAGGWHDIYFGLLSLLGTDPFDFPFLDAHALLSAAECKRLGVNVYIENPCDVLGRPHAYSPLWLSVIPAWLGTADTTALGLTLDLLFIASLAAVFRPRCWREILVCALAVFSPVVLFAAERANNDISIFVLIVAAALLWWNSDRRRLLSYSLCLLAGLLKYYPLVTLVLLARERWWRALALAGASGLAVLLLVGIDGRELALALSNIPTGTHFSDAFSAQNLPFGLMEMMGATAPPGKAISVALLLLLGAAAALRGWRIAGHLERWSIDWSVWEMHLLALASFLVPACFFAAQNISYRGIYLLLAVPGLLRLRQSIEDRALKRELTAAVVVVLFLLWGSTLFRGLEAVLGQNIRGAGGGIDLMTRMGYWFGRELIWWWLIAGFLGLAICHVRSLPLTGDVALGLRRVARFWPLAPSRVPASSARPGRIERAR